MCSQTPREKHVTDWNGVMQDLFGILDPSETTENTYESSSGFASDVASYNPSSCKMSTFKGDNLSLSSTDQRLSDSSFDRQFSDSSTDRPYIHKRLGEGKFPWAYTPGAKIAQQNQANRDRSFNNSTPVVQIGHAPKYIEQKNSPHSDYFEHPHPEYHHLESHKVNHINSKFSQLDLQDTEKLMLTSSKGKARYIRPSPFDLLTDDVIVNIFSNLPTDQICKCSRVCQRWYRLAWDPWLWKRIVISDETLDTDKAMKYLTKRLSYNTPTVCVIVERIILTGCERLTDKGLRLIAKRCPELRHLEIQGCSNISNNALFEVVSYCVNLEYLDVSGCPCITCIRLTDSILMQASAHHLRQVYLRHLDMTDCYALENDGLTAIATYCSQLQFLYLRRCVRIGDTGVQAIANNCYCLKELSISDCKKITDYGISELAKLKDSLRYLSVAKCDKVSDVGIIQVARGCRKLRYLNVRGCEAVSDDSLDTLARNCSRLKSLDVGKCDITDEGLFLLAQHCQQLKKLSVKSCDGITDRGVMTIAYYCRGLQQLIIQECHLSVEAYRTVKKYCKHCLIEHTNPAFY
ncbi:hypothetical protein CHS0354_004986 [Potamilus streckersoni]|uniref:F-box domain-containing protein n=1 Tax=Potamilus streckersoni TaxID=2493646 RepID=A0AAE0STC4_9BIVA|nr:hypothetical protein CHS0354_004986 [Potamilus streckersoni]